MILFLLQVVSKDEAENLVNAGNLLLMQEIMGQLYGVPSHEIDGLEDGKVLSKSLAPQSWSSGCCSSDRHRLPCVSLKLTSHDMRT